MGLGVAAALAFRRARFGLFYSMACSQYEITAYFVSLIAGVRLLLWCV